MGQQRRESDGPTGPERSADTPEGDAFVEYVEVEPTGSGSLDGLSFAVKDLIDIGGHEKPSHKYRTGDAVGCRLPPNRPQKEEKPLLTIVRKAPNPPRKTFMR
jgi:hypothetical protein